MADPKWGVKRLCRECGARFYDFKKEPIVCPSCQAEFELVQSVTKPRKEAKKDKPKKPAPAPVPAENAEKPEEDEELAVLKEIEGVEVEVEDDASDTKDDLIEDLSDLGGTEEVGPAKKPGVAD